MKVVFFSESGIVGKTPRNHPNARNDIAWSIMMDADWCPYGKQPTDHYDLGVVTIPKTKPNIPLFSCFFVADFSSSIRNNSSFE